jgi:hypothetical protein
MNEVNDGHFDEMFLSIEYLEKKYAGKRESLQDLPVQEESVPQ